MPARRMANSLLVEVVAELAAQYEIHANQIYKWRREFLRNASKAFDNGERSADAARVQQGPPP